MNSVVPIRKKIPMPVFIAAFAVIGLIATGLFYLSRPASRSVADTQASDAARAYVRSLQLSDVTMQATENFMNQQVVEVQGKIANHGPKSLRSVDVYCLFQGIDGHEIRRERLPIVQAKGVALKPGEVRPFRLPFDSIPEGWNQAMPRMVIAGIAFAD
jgi:hypothetical protein